VTVSRALSAALAYAQAKVEESHAFKSGTDEQHAAATKRSEALLDALRAATAEANPLFLVAGRVTVTRYMGAKETEAVTRLVRAADEAEAGRKFEQHYRDRSDPHGGDGYWADVLSVTPVIE